MERNETLLRKVGDVIAAEPKSYDQLTWYAPGSCGTVACIGGHAEILATGEDQCGDMAQEVLGLSNEEADTLFSVWWEPAGDLLTPLHERVQAALYALADGASVEEVTASG